MGIWNINWLFRRISSRKDSSGSRDKTKPTGIMRSQRRSNHRENTSGIINNGSIQRRRSRRESKKLQRTPRERRTYSFSPGRNDVIQVPEDIHRQHPVPPIPNLDGTRNNEGISKEVIESDPTKERNRAASQAQLEGSNWERVPTLHKRSGQELNRRKSSKRRREDHDREVEIRAMSATMPLKKQPVRMRSDVSLPQVSIRSSQSANDSRHASYKIATLDILSPHPTIRYAENPRYVRTASGDRSKKNRVSDRVKASEDILKSHKRVDDLVEEMDASELRELMERDQRRREKKKVEDQLKLERRLARRKAKDEAAKAQAVKNGTVPPQNMDRGVMGRELEGTSASEMSAIRRKGSTASQRRRGKRPAEDTAENDPFDGDHTDEQLTAEELVPGEQEQEESGAAIISPPRSPRLEQPATLSAPQLMELDSIPTSAPSNKSKTSKDRRELESNVRPHQSWTSFFKRSKNRRVSTDTPSSFSNTSRDSIPTRPEVAIQIPPIPLVRQVSSGVPKRTKSKFREDLPELPISPPDSRVQSPEIDVVPPMHSNYSEKLPAGRGSSESPSSDPIRQRRYDTPTSGLVSGHRSADAPSPEPGAVLSQSLASIGSEGSWLSGKAGGLGSKRGSMVPPHPLRDSASSLQKRYRDFSQSTDELGIAEDEYFSRLTPGLEEDLKLPEEGNRGPSSDEEDEEGLPSPTKWHVAAARQPQVIYHHDSRVVKSREGLLHDYINDDAETGPITPKDNKSFSFDEVPSPESPEAVVGRATSMELSRGPARQVSSASAKSRVIAEEC